MRIEDCFDYGMMGIASRDFPQEVVGKYAGKQLIVVAGAACVWDDLLKLGVRGDQNNGWHVMCVNDIFMHYPGVINHMYSNDREMFEGWQKARRRQYKRAYPNQISFHTIRHGAKYCWPWPGHGTSGLNAVYTGLALGYDKIVCCGMPLDDGPHYFDPPWAVTNFHNEVPTREDGTLAYWNQAKKMFRGKVRSMSGRTRELLGEPC